MDLTQPASETQTVFTAPRHLWWLSVITLGLLALLIILLVGLGVGLIMTSYLTSGLILIVLGALLVVILRQVMRNTRGLGRWRVALGDDHVKLYLPAARSLTHRLKPLALDLPLSEIESIETRLETYRSFGMANMNRGFALRLREGGVILLGEDRAQGTGMAHGHVAAAVSALVDRGISLRDLGMSEGGGGLLGVAFMRPADWDAPAVDDARAAMLGRRARRTGAIATGAAIVVLIVVAWQILL